MGCGMQRDWLFQSNLARACKRMTSKRSFDAIVIGSGIGGLAAAAALAKRGCRVIVLEQHFQLGGLTQTFSRREYTFATGVHYIGGVGETPGPEG